MRNIDEDHAFELFRQRKLDTLTEEEFDQRKHAMKINYDEIITKANARKEILQKLSGRLQEAPAKYDELQEVIQWIAELLELFNPLDAEGRALLPTPVRYSLEYGLSIHTFLLNAVTRQANGIGVGLKELAAHV